MDTHSSTKYINLALHLAPCVSLPVRRSGTQRRDKQTMPKQTPTTADEARQYAIDWQHWANDQNLSWSEISEWQGIFTALADKYGLTEEFKENGII